MSQPKPETSMPEHEEVKYLPLAEWQALSLATLEEAYALVPTQRQQYYREVLEREASKVSAATDAEELQVVEALLARFAQDALVPVGARWAKPPQRVKAAAMAGQPLVAPEEVYLPKGSAMPQPMLILAAVGLLFGCVVVFILLASGGGSEQAAADANSVTVPTLRDTVTPTPIALEEQDTIIRDGDRDLSRTLAYPVGLQVYPPGEQQPRVFVIQRRAVEYSEWEYDPNPDTASYLLGMSVRRVVGIPWSRENADLFARLQNGAVFHLILNTGAVIEYQFERQTEVRRSDTGAFRQISPGLVLVLMGELDEEGAPTATRQLVMAGYRPEQELLRAGFLSTDVEQQLAAIASPTPLIPTTTPLPARDQLYVELVKAAVSPEGYLVTDLRLYNGQFEPVTLYAEDVQIAFGHQPQPPGPWTPSTLATMSILPGQALDLTITWRWEKSMSHGMLLVLGYQFSIQFN